MFTEIPRKFYYFLAVFLVLNLLQSYFTELIYDEAYYWYYSQNMSWGYFDHPPMVAGLVKISSWFFSAELGVRFAGCLLSAGTVLMLWLLIDHPRKNEHIVAFFVLVFSMPLLNAYGFFTLPDTPLLFFTALFLLLYKKFITSPSISIATGLGVVMACLMYSKYHAVLVIVFVLLSNISLVKNKYAWYAVLIALICYAPHFYWLYENNFVSINYHLYERPNDAYNFEKYTLGFLVNLIAIFGLTFPFIYKTLWKTKSTDAFTKALLFLSYGVILFFFFSSFNRRVQTQWVIIICIPLAVLVYNRILHHEPTAKWLFRLGLANIIIILYLRIGLAYQPLLFNFHYESHGNKAWVQTLASEAGATPVVFENSYRNAPMYSFYSGNTAVSCNNLMYRKNQYSIDQSEEEVRNKEVLYISKYKKKGDFKFTKPDGTQYIGDYIAAFHSYRKLKTFVSASDENTALNESGIFGVYNPYPFEVSTSELRYAIAMLNKYKKVKELIPVTVKPLVENKTVLTAKDTTYFKRDPIIHGDNNYTSYRIVISENKLYFGLNGKPIPLAP